MKLRARLSYLRSALTGRVSAPSKFSRYAGGDHSRIVAKWFAELNDPNAELVWSLSTLRARSRELCRDNGEAAGILLDFESDIVGAAGARLQFRATTARGKQLESLNDRVETQFAIWCRRQYCTASGASSFAALQRLMMRTVVMDGEFLAIRRRDPNRLHGYTLQPIDADQLDETHNTTPDGSGAQITMGVEVNSDGKPVAYHIWDRHPTQAGRRRQRIPASDVLHVFKRLRVGQQRGVPWFAPALVTWKLGDRYTEAELYQSLLAAAQGGFFVNKDGAAFDAPKDANGNPLPLVMEAVPGQATALPGGYEFQAWQPTHPTANYVGFMKAVKRVIARAFGRSYASLTGDLSDVNFSSMRTDRVREIEQNKLHQADILVEQFCDVVFFDWVRMASLMGALGVVTQSAQELAAAATWMSKGWPWIDPVKDLAAAELALKHGLTSRQALCAERGVDFFEVINALEEEAAYAKEHGVELGAADAVLGIAADPMQDTTDTPNGQPTDSAPTPARSRPPLRITA